MEDLIFFCLIHEPVDVGKSCIKKKTKSLMISFLFHMPERQRVLSSFLLTFKEICRSKVEDLCKGYPL